ncbi:hypothetical protein MTR67_010206, partial [Solanum verrucosum]
LCSHNLTDPVTVTMLFSDGAVLGILLEMPRYYNFSNYLLDSGSFMPSQSSATMDIRYPDERNNDFTTSVLSTSLSRSPETVGFRYDNERFDTSAQFPRLLTGGDGSA